MYYTNLIIKDIQNLPNAAGNTCVKRMRTARREIINFISVFVHKNRDDIQGRQHFTNNYATHLMFILE